jgi:hypothetical protein
MPKPEMVTMSMRELDRFKMIQAVVEHGLMVWRATETVAMARRAATLRDRRPTTPSAGKGLLFQGHCAHCFCRDKYCS